jgi:hypothetical protein
MGTGDRLTIHEPSPISGKEALPQREREIVNIQERTCGMYYKNILTIVSDDRK